MIALAAFIAALLLCALLVLALTFRVEMAEMTDDDTDEKGGEL